MELHVSQICKDILFILFIIDAIAFEECFTRPKLEIPSPSNFQSSNSLNLYPDTLIIGVKTKGFLNSIFSNSKKSFQKHLCI